jgi:DNA replication and repair protein RecF
MEYRIKEEVVSSIMMIALMYRDVDYSRSKAMFVKQLSLENYRNIQSLHLETDAPVNIIIGPNAQGKTNILESIFVLALTKSHRTSKDKELIAWNAESARIIGEIHKKYGTNKLDLQINMRGKTAKVNGLEQRKLSGFIGSLNVVMFAPEDLEIVKGSPGVRRRFMDMELGQVHPAYLHHLLQYQKIVIQKNTSIKKMNIHNEADQVMMDVWNDQLVEHGVRIMKNRQSFIHKLQKWAEHIHQGITNGKEKLRIVYRPSFEAEDYQDETVLINQFMIKLSQVREQEQRRGICLIGPHRDDLEFYINDKEVMAYGSQGQQRTTALSLKLAELELIREEVGEYPVLLLDDVLSELDQFRQTQLIETFQDKVQTFITTTGIESINASKLTRAKLFHVQDGQVRAQ